MIADYFNKYEWFLLDKREVDFHEADLIAEKILERIKKRIARQTVLKQASDYHKITPFDNISQTFNLFIPSPAFKAKN